MKETLLFATLLLTVFMTGVIWFVQMVHYPIFLKVTPSSFTEFHQAHTVWTGRVVMLPMILELIGATGLLWIRWESSLPNGLNYVAFGLLVAVWGITGLVSVPLHNRLAGGYDAVVIHQLIYSNWLRTAAWTLRSGILLYLITQK